MPLLQRKKSYCWFVFFCPLASLIHPPYCVYFFFSLNTPPGTKVKVLGTVQVKNGILLLDDSKISVLGGEVDHMMEKWELQRSLAKHSRSNIGREGGAPPFVPFGQV
uniref:RecQ mediated genome instability protein 1 OB-fold domain-containing protein n=1 Tax=Hucho hucho TaxID=62062 RepID=A0A4W5JUV9_9TELE